eukprot:5868869-Amphidinium_carterae.3
MLIPQSAKRQPPQSQEPVISLKPLHPPYQVQQPLQRRQCLSLKTTPASLLVQSKPTPVAQTSASASSSSETTGDPIINATPEPPTCQPDSEPKLLAKSVNPTVKMPEIPPDALVEEVDPRTMPTFGEWKKRMDAAPRCVQTDAQTTECYHPLGDIIGFETPVDNMSELEPASNNNVFRFRGSQIAFSRPMRISTLMDAEFRHMKRDLQAMKACLSTTKDRW